MKFGKKFKKEMVPEWTEAYMDYNVLKRILREIIRYKQSMRPIVDNRALQQKQTSDETLSGLLLQSGDLESKGDIENKVTDVDTSQQDGSREIYETKFFRQFEDLGESEIMFFRKLDRELNKVNNFYKAKAEELMHEASLLDKQMDALVALRVKVRNPDLDGSTLKRRTLSHVNLRMAQTCSTSSRNRIQGKSRNKTVYYLFSCKWKTCIQWSDYL